jgi:Ca2+:H+ antiporter
MADLDSIKRQARREAWYSDSYNPFHNITRSTSWAPTGQATGGDLEAGQSSRPVPEDEESFAPLSATQTEPAYDPSHQQGNKGTVVDSE